VTKDVIMFCLDGAIIGREEWKKLPENPAPLPT
jgi:hypothetical protein